MFDDINIKPAGQVPGNLPVSEPDDIFAGTDAPDINQSSAVSAGKLQPKVQTMPEELSRLNKVKNPIFAKNMMILAIVLVGVGILAGGSWLVYTMFVRPTSEVNEFVLPDNADQIIEEKTETTAQTNAQTDDSVLFGEPVDSDADNLTDIREKELGTDPNNWDSDGDGVSDGDEVLVWKSNSLNKDTDGDGFMDGAEIKNGYNPIGPGKIFDKPQQ